MARPAIAQTEAPETDFNERRRAPRIRARPVDLMLHTSVFVDMVRLLNVGRMGFSVSTPIAYPSGTALELDVPGKGRLKASAVWYSRNQLGARFAEPLDLDTLLSLTEEE